MSLRSVPPFHWRHSHRSFIANQFLSGKSWHWIIHLVPPYIGQIPQDWEKVEFFISLVVSLPVKYPFFITSLYREPVKTYLANFLR